MSTYFTAGSLKFLRGLERHNEREWFLAHKADYEESVRAPFQRLLTDLQPALAAPARALSMMRPLAGVGCCCGWPSVGRVGGM